MSRTFQRLRRPQAVLRAAGPSAGAIQRVMAATAPESAGCACGGGCPRCAGAALQAKAVDGVLQRDQFKLHPEHSEEEIFAAIDATGPEEETEEAPPEEMDMGGMGGMGGMQMKLIVGSQDDPSEREADEAAEAIVAGTGQVEGVRSGGAPTVQRSVVQDSGMKPPAALSDYLADPGPGSPVPDSSRSQIEQGLGADLGHVRVHTDARAQQAAASVGARAFTLGANIWLGKNESTDDTRLLAHEMTHVVQQGHGGACSVVPGADGAGPSSDDSPAAPALQRKIIKSPAKLVDFIQGTQHKTETRTDPVSGSSVPAFTHMLEHEKWHTTDHPDPLDPAGKDINDPFGTAFMEFHHTMMNGYKAAGGPATPWSASTQPPTGEDFSIFADPAKLAKIKTSNQFGNLIVGPHNGSHGFFGGADPEDKGMNDFYWAPRHDVFYNLHLWMDDRYMDWKALKAPKKAKKP